MRTDYLSNSSNHSKNVSVDKRQMMIQEALTNNKNNHSVVQKNTNKLAPAAKALMKTISNLDNNSKINKTFTSGLNSLTMNELANDFNNLLTPICPRYLNDSCV